MTPDTRSDATPTATGFAFATGRRTRWIVTLAWILALGWMQGAGLQEKFSETTKTTSSTSVAGDSESFRADALVEKIEARDQLPFIAVVSRDDGLTAGDKAAIERQVSEFNRLSPDAEVTVTDDDGASRSVTLDGVQRGPGGQYLAVAQFSEDGTSAMIVGAVGQSSDNDLVTDSIDALRSATSPLAGDGLTVNVTGGAGFVYDALNTFGNLDATMVGAAVLLVIVLLILIYRSPILFLLPLLGIGFAEMAARSLSYYLTELGILVSAQSSSIASILLLGAGSNYALLIVSRYREELRRREDRIESIRIAMHAAGPAVLASGLTVIAGLLTLTLASVESTAGLGPVGAMSVAIAMIAMLTLLPALFSVLPRGVFWPLTPRVGTTGADATHGMWRRAGEAVGRHPRRTWVITTGALLICAIGMTSMNSNLSRGETFLGTVESAAGAQQIDKVFNPGDSAPTKVVVPSDRLDRVQQAFDDHPKVSRTSPGAEGDGRTVLDVILTVDPYSTEANGLVPELRRVAQDAGGPETLVGGETASEADLNVANDRDLKLIVPIVLVVVFLILIGLLRALVLPVVLLGTVIVSFAAALGISSVLFDLLGFAGTDRTVILYGFVFLIALGVDYNIFLTTRIREEALGHGTPEGVLRGVAATGGVITAAGIILAGTFLVLATTPVLALVELGLLVGIGVVIDTFIVRSILVPAFSLDIGRPIWWPRADAFPEDTPAVAGAAD